MFYCFKSEESDCWIQGISDEGVQWANSIKIFEMSEEEAEDFAEKCADVLSRGGITTIEVHLKKASTVKPFRQFQLIADGAKFYWDDILFVKISPSHAVALEAREGVVELGYIALFLDHIMVKRFNG
jgi:hypothetical protein